MAELEDEWHCGVEREGESNGSKGKESTGREREMGRGKPETALSIEILEQCFDAVNSCVFWSIQRHFSSNT